MNPRLVLRALVIGVWAAFFFWLGLTGEMTRYLGPRTYWVVWFGAIALTLATLLHLPNLRTRGGRIGLSDIGGAIMLAVPLILVLAIPRPDLGALAASRKQTGLATLSSAIPRPPAEPGELDFAEIHFASESSEYATVVGATEGAEVELEGFVTYPKRAPEGTFALTRFYISCCAADAIPFSVFVASDEDFEEDQWLRVEGRLAIEENEFVIEPDIVRKIRAPSRPYLY